MAETWTPLRRTLWLVIAAFVCLWQGLPFLTSLRTSPNEITDFYQDWASARNYRSGLPIYLDQGESLQHHLGWTPDSAAALRENRFFIKVNAHPPTSVLLALPFAALDYPDAFLVWNVVSLAALGVSAWLVARQLSLPLLPETVAAFVALLLTCTPFRAQMAEGQINLILLLLIVGVWAADRTGKAAVAGALLGIATAIKLFPAFLVLYFLMRRRWSALAAAAIAFALITCLTAAVFGPAVFQAYFHEALPQVWLHRGGWNNVSLVGFWSRLFDVNMRPEPVVPLLEAPALASILIAASGVMLVLVVLLATLRARGQPDCDLAFGITVIAMLLVTPTAWGHYLVLLFLPLIVIGRGLPPSIQHWALFALILASIWMNPNWLYDVFIPGGRRQGTATPVDSLTILAVQTYALLGLLLLAALMLRKHRQDAAG